MDVVSSIVVFALISLFLNLFRRESEPISASRRLAEQAEQFAATHNFARAEEQFCI